MTNLPPFHVPLQAYFGPVNLAAPADSAAPSSGVLSYFASIGFPCPQMTNPADFLLDLLFDQGKGQSLTGSSRVSRPSLAPAQVGAAPGAQAPLPLPPPRKVKGVVTHNDSCLPLHVRRNPPLVFRPSSPFAVLRRAWDASSSNATRRCRLTGAASLRQMDALWASPGHTVPLQQGAPSQGASGSSDLGPMDIELGEQQDSAPAAGANPDAAHEVEMVRRAATARRTCVQQAPHPPRLPPSSERPMHPPPLFHEQRRRFAIEMNKKYLSSPVPALMMAPPARLPAPLDHAGGNSTAYPESAAAGRKESPARGPDPTCACLCQG